MILWRSNFEFDQGDIDNLIENVISNYTRSPNLATSYYENNIHKRPEICFLKQYSKIVSQFMKDLGFFHRSNYSFDHWTQVYLSDTQFGHRVHDHWDACTPLSWVHFIKPAPLPCFYFLDSQGKKSWPKQDKGDFIVFPSWALHAVVGSADRAVVAGNVSVSMFVSPTDKNKDMEYTVSEQGQEIGDEILTKRREVDSYIDWSVFL